MEFKQGDKVQITTDWSDYRKTAAKYVNRISTLSGTVIPSQAFDDHNTVRLATGNVNFPESVIAFKYITDVKINKEVVNFEFNPIIKNDKETWQVKGSKPGKTYTVTRNKDKWNCTCPGFQFRSKCKHVKEKHEIYYG